jgi:hypothetical protein
MYRPVRLKEYYNGPDFGEWVRDVQYEVGGELKEMTYCAGCSDPLTYYVPGHYYTEQRFYNVRGHMNEMKVTPTPSPTTPVMHLEYRFSATNNDGRITSMKDHVTGEDVTYQYDSLNR